MSVLLESGSRIGWLYNYHSATVDSPSDDVSGQPASRSALTLLLQDHGGDTFHVQKVYSPYFLLIAVAGHERDVELGITSMFGSIIQDVSIVMKEDLDMLNHLSGKERTCLKVSFLSTNDLVTVRGAISKIIKRNSSVTTENPLFEQVSLKDAMNRNFGAGSENSSSWTDFVQDMREYDVKYNMRVSIDLSLFVGLWYEVTVTDGEVTITKCDESAYAPAIPRIIAFDIETTKAPLKFPQPEEDQIYMISYMLDSRGYLIINREIVAAEIDSFEYTPKPEYEGIFETFNEVDEAATLRRFYTEIQKYQPNIFVTYNGDYFDFPFIHARSLVHGMNMRNEIGFSQGADGAFLCQATPHLDCFYWVKRDSYLPQGSQGLKAVTKSKLGYDPIEVDPEEMLPLCQSAPQRLASYSVSDALSTWFLYLKYVHPFIFSLATIIPMAPDDVLRKGSGGLCESLLMVEANFKNVLFPNKKEMVREKLHDGHLIDTETYIGGRVEALRSGVYRSDLPIQFAMNPDTYQELIDKVEEALTFAVEVENGLKKEDVENFGEVMDDIVKKLEFLRDHPKMMEKPIIYHLDVGAMYPNIILTNRLQPYAIPSPEVCASCCYNSPTNEHQCKRSMMWKWRGELFTAGRYELQRVKAQLENESFAQSIIDQTNLASVQKKAYGIRSGNVLENTKFEQKKNDWKGKKRFSNNRSSYRKGAPNEEFDRAAAAGAASSDSDSSSDEDENGLKAFHKLNEPTQFNMLKKRLAEYSRKVYGKVHKTEELMKTNVVCQRENSFYVDTVRLFRDRRYEYKAALKTWKKKLSAAADLDEKRLCESRCVQMESLQLAHKCILNSFYGYVMRKGSRWYSMEMAGIVTFLGASLIQMARALVQHIGITLELDTDGIWCCLPCVFPENYTFTTKDPKKPKVSVSYPCIVLNKMVHDRYTNPQYQTLSEGGTYSIRNENSIYFEVDGPYLAMLLPASKEEGKGIKKRYAVFNPNGSLAELKGFELKRRGELMLIKDFQSQVFRKFLNGTSLVEAYASAAVVADAALDMLDSKGEGYDVDEIIEKISESSSMSRRLSEYPDSRKSLAITTARRIAEFLGPQMVKDKGLSCRFIISRLPLGRPVTERAIPVNIFRADPVLRTHFLRKWTGDSSFPTQLDLQQLIDWEYYTGRFNGCVQKIITIPAALQSIPNPVPRVKHPDWLRKALQQQASTFRQLSLTKLFDAVPDMEDIVPHTAAASSPEVVIADDSSDESESVSDNEEEREVEEAIAALHQTYFTPGNVNKLSQNFFSEKGTPAWLSKQKQGWIHRAKLRRELGLTSSTDDSASVSIQSLFVDQTARAMALPWHIIEVRPPKEDSDLLTVVVALEKTLHSFQVRVPRYVVVDVDAGFSLSALGVEKYTRLNNAVLPRRQLAGEVYQVFLSPGIAGDKTLNELSIQEGVRGIYEAHITQEMRLVEQIGCCAQVNSALHIENSQRLPPSQRDIFHFDEFYPISSTSYLTNSANRSVYIYHVVADARGLICLVNQTSSNAVAVFVQGASVSRPNVNWLTMCEDVRKKLNSSMPNLTVSIEVASEVAAAWRIVYQKLIEMTESPLNPSVAVLHSTSSATQLISQRFLPSTLPYLRILGAADDEKLLADPFRWSSLLSRRMLQRYYSSSFWVEERTALSRICGIPMCNLQQDSYIHALDVLYCRALHQRSHVLWCSSDAKVAFDVVEERPRDVVLPGGYSTWCIEFSLSRLDVVAVLFSQMIQESDGNASHFLCDRGVASHFNILRDLISGLLSQAVRDDIADALLRHVTRWVRDPVALTYEPRITETLSALSHSVLTAVLLRLAKLGGKPIKVDSSSVIVLSPKYSFSDAMDFANYVTSGVRDQPMLTLLSLQTLRYLVPTVVMDRWNVGTLSISEAESHQYANSEASLECLSFDLKLSILERLPTSLREQFRQRVRSALLRIYSIVMDTLSEANDDPAVILATKNEYMEKRIAGSIGRYFEKELHMELIQEVDSIVRQTSELFSTEERSQLEKGSSHTGSPPPSNRTVALEYAKCMCQLLEAFNTVAVEKLKNNCLRLCGVSPFSSTAQFSVSPLEAHRFQTLVCSFCNSSITVNLTNLTNEVYICVECKAPISKASMEAHLVRHVTALVMNLCAEDYKCSRCGEMVSTYIADSCCGPLIGSSCSITPELKALEFYANLLEFTWLKETISAALLAAS